MKSSTTLGLVLLALSLSGCHSANQSNPSLTATTTVAVDLARYHSEIQANEALLSHLPDRGAGLFFLSARYARLGDSQKALSLLKECLSLHQGFDPAYRFDRQTHTFTPLTFPRALLYPNGVTLSGDKHLLYAADMLGVLCLDLRNNSAHEVTPGERTPSLA